MNFASWLMLRAAVPPDGSATHTYKGAPNTISYACNTLDASNIWLCPCLCSPRMCTHTLSTEGALQWNVISCLSLCARPQTQLRDLIGNVDRGSYNILWRLLYAMCRMTTRNVLLAARVIRWYLARCRKITTFVRLMVTINIWRKSRSLQPHCTQELHTSKR